MRIDRVPDEPISRRSFLAAAAAGSAGAFLAGGSSLAAQDKEPADLKKRVDDAVERGLEWLKRTKANGHWSATGGNYPTAMTALAGMCFLMEGSSLKEGKYSNEIQDVVDWFLAPGRQQPNGLIGNVQNPTEARRYMYGQGFATLFLASVYGEAEDKERQEKLENCLKKAVDFIAKAQTSKKHRLPEGKEVDIGGWGYVSATDSNQFDEGSVTITQLQALRAARNAAIPVPKETINKALAYLEACTTPAGGVIYSYSQSGGAARNGSERIPLTAAAVACSFSAGQYKGDLAKKWIKFCKDKIPLRGGRMAHNEYQHYYLAQAIYVLGEDRYGEMFPNEDKKNWLTWSKYRDAMFSDILDQQDKTSGAWTIGSVGPVYVTSIYVSILQLEKGILPIYQR